MKKDAVDSVNLAENEKIQHYVKPGWAKWGRILMISIFSLTLFIGVFGIIGVWIARRNHWYIVTNKRIIEVSGLLKTHTTEYRINNIRNVGTAQGFFETIAGQGRIQIIIGEVSNTVFDGISNYHEIANTIGELQKTQNEALSSSES